MVVVNELGNHPHIAGEIRANARSLDAAPYVSLRVLLECFANLFHQLDGVAELFFALGLLLGCDYSTAKFQVGQ